MITSSPTLGKSHISAISATTHLHEGALLKDTYEHILCESLFNANGATTPQTIGQTLQDICSLTLEKKRTIAQGVIFQVLHLVISIGI